MEETGLERRGNLRGGGAGSMSREGRKVVAGEGEERSQESRIVARRREG
jgi:hypothetical protein